MKTIKIKEQTHKELTKVKGQLIAQTGKPDLSYDDAIMQLIMKWRE